MDGGQRPGCYVDLDGKWNVVWNYQTQQSFRLDRDSVMFRIL